MDAETKALLFVLVVVLVIVCLSIIAFKENIDRTDDPGMKGCPNDARTCPDGSVAVRTLPYCDYEPCQEKTV